MTSVVLAVTFEIDDAVLDGGALGSTEAEVTAMVEGSVRTQVSALRFLRSVSAVQVWPLPPEVAVHNPDYSGCVKHIIGEVAVEGAACPACEADRARRGERWG